MLALPTVHIWREGSTQARKLFVATSSVQVFGSHSTTTQPPTRARARKHRSGVMGGARRTGKSPQFSLHRAHSLQQQRGLTFGVDRQKVCVRSSASLHIQNERHIHNASIWCRCVVDTYIKAVPAVTFVMRTIELSCAAAMATVAASHGHLGRPIAPWRTSQFSTKKKAVLARVKSCTHTSSYRPRLLNPATQLCMKRLH